MSQILLVVLINSIFCIKAWSDDASAGVAPGLVPQECYVGQYMARIVPEQMRSFVSPAAGTITRLVDDGGRVPKGTVIAALNESDIELERDELELSILKERIDREEEVNKLKREREELVFLLGLSDRERQLGKSDVNKEVSERIVNLLDRKMELAEKELDVQHQRKKEEFKKKEESFVIKMPFDGRIQYPFQLKEDAPKEAYVDASKEMVSVCDDSSFYLVVTVSSPEIARIPSQQFRLVAELGDGEVLETEFSHKQVQKASGGGPNTENLIFYFKITKGDPDKIFDMLGVNCVAKLYYKGGENIAMFNKIELSALPEAKDAPTWEKLLSMVKPDYELILIGETQIIARKK